MRLIWWNCWVNNESKTQTRINKNKKNKRQSHKIKILRGLEKFYSTSHTNFIWSLTICCVVILQLHESIYKRRNWPNQNRSRSLKYLTLIGVQIFLSKSYSESDSTNPTIGTIVKVFFVGNQGKYIRISEKLTRGSTLPIKKAYSIVKVKPIWWLSLMFKSGQVYT